MESSKRGSAGAIAVWSVTTVGLAALWTAPAPAGTAAADTLGKTTLEQKVVPDDATGYNQLELDATAGGYVVREEGIGVAQAGREARRRSLLYFGQLSDFQLADEE